MSEVIRLNRALDRLTAKEKTILAQTADGGDTLMSDKFSSLLSKLRKQYPLLSDLIDNVDIIDRREQGMDGTGRKLEWQEAHDDRYDKHVMEIFDPALKGTELDQAVLGELLHSAHKYVPEYSQMREQLKSELSNSDVDNLIGIYEQSGDNRSFDKWFDISGLDAFIRGHAVGQWPDNKYTDGQKKLIDKMMGSLKGKTDMDSAGGGGIHEIGKGAMRRAAAKTFGKKLM